jgi:hypothetical protein
MAWWLTVYCRKRVESPDPAEIAAGLRGEDPGGRAGLDYLGLAAEHGIDEAKAKAAIAALSVFPIDEGPFDLEVRYSNEPEARPIFVHGWSGTERVAEEIREAVENREPPKSTLARVKAAKQVIGIELGYSQLRDMGLVIAIELARWLAQKGDGVFVDDDGEWFAVVDGEFVDP